MPTHMSDQEHLIEVPYTALQPDTLRRLIEEFVTRDTTDYGVRVRTLDEKVADVMRQLRRGEVVIVLEQVSNTINLVTAASVKRT
jgi:uncharacterized protein YheU (UPF0270 family)